MLSQKWECRAHLVAEGYVRLVYLLVGRDVALVAVDAIQPLARTGHPRIAVVLEAKAQDIRFGVAFEKVRCLLGEDVRRETVETRRLRVDIRRPV